MMALPADKQSHRQYANQTSPRPKRLNSYNKHLKKNIIFTHTTPAYNYNLLA